MSILTNLLSLLGNNNLIPAIIPSLAFVLATIVLFDPIIKASAVLQQQSGVDLIVPFSLFLVLPTIIISYTLTALNPYLLKFFEGNIILTPVSFLYRRSAKVHTLRSQKLIQDLTETKKKINALEKKPNKINRQLSEGHLIQLRQKYYTLAAEYDQNYPQETDEIGPTAVGNILRAAQTYAGTRYGMDGVAFWPRLVQVIPKEYKEAIDASRNELSFLFNFAFLSIIFSYLCVLSIFFLMANTPVDSGSAADFIVFITAVIRFLVTAALAMALGSFFYRASMYSVRSYGVLIRSAYDLFRLDLLEQLRIKLPRNSVEEFFIWKNMNELILIGQNSLEFKPINYMVDTKRISSTKTVHKKKAKKA
jgi:hypothetical protein